EAALQLPKLGARQRVGERADQRDGVALAREPARGHPRGIRERADHPDDRRRVDRPLRALVVGRRVAAPYRHAQRSAGVAEPARRTVREPTTESYCSYAQRLLATPGEASSASRDSAGDASWCRRARGAG